MTLQEILSANRELVINNYNSNIQLRNYTQMSLREYMLGVMAWFADHSGSARKVVANPESRYIVESFINKACAEVGGNAVKKASRSYSFQMRMAAGDPAAESRVRIAYGK